MKVLGGKIDVKSEYGKGSTFVVELDFEWLPVASKVKDDNSSSSSLTIRNRSNKKYKVLCVDDNYINRKLLCKFITTDEVMSWCIDVHEAKNGQIALEKVLKGESDNHPFDLVLMDLTVSMVQEY